MNGILTVSKLQIGHFNINFIEYALMPIPENLVQRRIWA